MIKLLLDQGIPYSTGMQLPAEWDVVHVADVEMSYATDRDIIEYAQQQHRICVTLDSDFHSILAVDNMSLPSVIRIRQEGLKAKDLARLLCQIWPSIEEQVQSGAMVSVDDKQLRIRRLPILQ
ncbi:MAG: hypothetical protein CSB48_14475 [Proteobacteria bacterium]|nr:MAG: hypothetical protein CSB48_14475 [Pseudomonadota bacterium]